MMKMKGELGDCYISDMKYYERYRSFQETGEVTDLNHASLARPYKEVMEAIKSGRSKTALDARVEAASIIGLDDPSRVIFGRNTTEALSFTYWLADVERGNVVTTDVENKSVPRIYKQHRDHGNTRKKDMWSTFPDDIVSENYGGIDEIVETNVPVNTVPLYGTYDINQIVDAVDDNTRLVVVSHVSRNDGRIIDVKELAMKVKEKNPKTYVAVDGAMALGNLPRIDFKELEEAGVDFYAATPHKTMGSYPLGILYLSKRAAENIRNLKGRSPLEQTIMEGMIPEKYGVSPNVDAKLNRKRFASIVTAVETLREKGFLEGNNFGKKSEYQVELKEYFIDKLREYNAEIMSEGKDYSPAIISFRLGKNDPQITEKMQQRGVFTSYISATKNIRASVDITNSKSDIERYFSVLEELKREG